MKEKLKKVLITLKSSDFVKSMILTMSMILTLYIADSFLEKDIVNSGNSKVVFDTFNTEKDKTINEVKKYEDNKSDKFDLYKLETIVKKSEMTEKDFLEGLKITNQIIKFSLKNEDIFDEVLNLYNRNIDKFLNSYLNKSQSNLFGDVSYLDTYDYLKIFEEINKNLTKEDKAYKEAELVILSLMLRDFYCNKNLNEKEEIDNIKVVNYLIDTKINNF